MAKKTDDEKRFIDDLREVHGAETRWETPKQREASHNMGIQGDIAARKAERERRDRFVRRPDREGTEG